MGLSMTRLFGFGGRWTRICFSTGVGLGFESGRDPLAVVVPHLLRFLRFINAAPSLLLATPSNGCLTLSLVRIFQLGLSYVFILVGRVPC